MDRNNFRIKTIKLKGQISQGYCIPLKALEEHPTRKMKLITNASETPFLEDQQTKEIIRLEIGTDLTEYIGIQKYEAPTSTFMKVLAITLKLTFLLSNLTDLTNFRLEKRNPFLHLFLKLIKFEFKI